MNRLLLTLVTAFLLTATYRVYARWTDGLTAIVTPPPAPPVVTETPVQPGIMREIAQRVLPDEAWMQRANYSFERDREGQPGKTFLYTDRYDILGEGEGNFVEFTPFVLVWTDSDDPAATPYAIYAESARIQFQKTFTLQLEGGDPGRMTAGQLVGKVRLSGPDNLRVSGEEFQFRDQDKLLYSDYPVEFHAGPRRDERNEVHGRADGIQLNLSTGLGGDSRGSMPQIGGIASVVLRRNVDITITFERDDPSPDKTERPAQARRQAEPPPLTTAHISSNGSLKYVVDTHLATLDDQVRVVVDTPTARHPEWQDQLACDVLALLFEEQAEGAAAGDRASAVAGEPAEGDVPVAAGASADKANSKSERGPFTNLAFSKLFARGRPVELKSDENDVTATMKVLRYEAATQTAELLASTEGVQGASSAATNAAEMVRIVREASTLMAPEVRIVRGTSEEDVSFAGIGPGQFTQTNPKTDELMLRAFWDDQMSVAPDPETGLILIRLDGRGRALMHEEAGVIGDVIALWVDPVAARSLRSASEEAPAGADRFNGGGPQIPIRFALAEGDVLLRSKQTYVSTDRLEAIFAAGALPDDSKPADATEGDARVAGAKEKPQLQPVWDLEAGVAKLKLLHNPANLEEISVAEATVEGNVAATQSFPGAEELPPEDRPEAMSMTGSRMHLVNLGGTDQVAELIGEENSPAHVRRGETHVEAGNIRLDRTAGTVSVAGKGLIQFPVKRAALQEFRPDAVAADGAAAGEPERPSQPAADDSESPPLLCDVHWQESMSFDGTRGRFLKNVRLSLNESLLQCEEMIVELNQPIDFREKRPRAENVQVQSVLCQDGVTLELHEWDETRLTGMRKGQLARFALDYSTGDFVGDGPGWITDWSRDAPQQLAMARRTEAKANQPADSDALPWNYTSVRFRQKMSGNTRDRLVRLEGAVEAIFAPVDRPLATFSRSALSGNSANAKDAAWLKADELTVTMHDWPAAEPPADLGTGAKDKAAKRSFARFGASGRCEIEGQKFRAVASALSYDQSQEQFILKGRGTEDAAIYYQDKPGSDPRALRSRVIYFAPSRNELKLEGAKGIQGAP